MDCSQDLLELDSEISGINNFRDSNPFLPLLPLLEISEEALEYGLNTPPVTPLQSPHAFLKEKRWLFSLPPLVLTAYTHFEVKPPLDTSDITEIGPHSTSHVSVREKKSATFRKRTAHPKSQSLMLEGYPPRKRIRSNTVAAHLDQSAQGMLKPPTHTGNDHSGKTSVHPILLVRPVTLPVGSEPIIWHPPSLLQIISHPTPDLVR